MANTDRPRGFWPAYTLHGGPPHMRRVKKAGVNIFKGDILKNSATLVMGGVVPVADGDTDRPCGVAAEYSTGAGTTSAAHYVNMYDDLDNTIFVGQCDTTGICGTSDTMLTYTAIVTAASTCDANETSIMEIDASATALNGMLFAIDKVDRVDNDFGEYSEIYCKVLTDLGKIRVGMTT